MDGLLGDMRIGCEDEAGFVRDGRRGDRQAFAVLVHRHWDRVHRWLFHLTHDVQLAEAATRETFLQAYSALPTLEPDLGFHAWLCRIAHGVADRDSGPRRKVRLRAPRELRGRDDAPPELARVRAELRRLLERVGRLPRTLRGAYLLRTEPGFRFAEIARVLEIPEKHARWRVRLARERLLQALYVPCADRIEEPACRAHRQRLLRAEEVLVPDEELADHLAICWKCSDWHEQLARIEARAGSIFVPPSRGRDRFLRLFLAPGEPGGARGRLPAPNQRRTPLGSRLQPNAPGRRVGWRGLVLGAVAVALLVWVGIRLGDALTDWVASAEAAGALSEPSK